MKRKSVSSFPPQRRNRVPPAPSSPCGPPGGQSPTRKCCCCSRTRPGRARPRTRMARRSLTCNATHLPMTVFIAAHGYAACVEREWTPNQGALAVELEALPEGGAVIFSEATGHLPGLKGRLNPIRDTHDRTYLYASNYRCQPGPATARSLRAPAKT